MSRRFLLTVACFLTVIPLTAIGQDAGIPDTVRLIGDTLVIGRSMPVHVSIFNDEEITINVIIGGLCIFLASIGAILIQNIKKPEENSEITENE